MGSIIGEKNWHNAETTASIDASIATVTIKLNEATTLYNAAMDAITACGNRSIGCLDKTGRHISSWRDQRDKYAPVIEKYKKELSELLVLKGTMATATVQTAQSQQVVAKANEALASAESAATNVTAKKWLLYGGIAVVVIGLGIFAYIKLKKRK